MDANWVGIQVSFRDIVDFYSSQDIEFLEEMVNALKGRRGNNA